MFRNPLETLRPEIEPVEMRATRSLYRPERRRRARSRVHWPVRFFGAAVGGTFETVTDNLSSCGFHCFSPVALSAGDLMICLLGVPRHRTCANLHGLALECEVRITRVEQEENSESYSVACEIKDYRFVAE